MEEELDLNDVIDLSVMELYILNYLVRVAGSVVRFAVLTGINAQLGEAEVSRSSFYNSLSRLEEKGLVEIEDNPEGKGSLVQATSRASQAINQVNIFSIWGSLNPAPYFQKLLDDYQGLLYPDGVERQLIIPFVEPVNEVILSQILKLPKINYVLVAEEYHERLKRGRDLSLARVAHGMIREPDGFFDQVILFRYHLNAHLLELSFEQLIEEAARVCNKGGRLVFVGIDELQLSKNSMLEQNLRQLLGNDINDRIEHLEEIIDRVLDDVNVDRYQDYGVHLIIVTL